MYLDKPPLKEGVANRGERRNYRCSDREFFESEPSLCSASDHATLLSALLEEGVYEGLGVEGFEVAEFFVRGPAINGRTANGSILTPRLSKGKAMDTFDIVAAGVFLLLMLLVTARLNFWKQGGELLTLRVVLAPILLCAIATLDFSAWHHWNAPHRRQYQGILSLSAVAVSFGQIILTLYTQRREAARKK